MTIKWPLMYCVWRVSSFCFFIQKIKTIKMSALTLLVSFGFMCVAFAFVCTVEFKRFSLVESVDHKICRPQDRIFTVSVPSYVYNHGLTVCITHCISNGVCKSIFYNSVDSTCTACSGVYNVTSALDESTGSKYYVSNSSKKLILYSS